MSGGGYTAPEVDVGGIGPTDCSRVRFIAVLESVDDDVLDTCSVGDILRVEMFGDGAPTLVIGVVTQVTSELLGALTVRWAELKRCLELGTTFSAELLTDSHPVRVRMWAG